MFESLYEFPVMIVYCIVLSEVRCDAQTIFRCYSVILEKMEGKKADIKIQYLSDMDVNMRGVLEILDSNISL